MTSETLRIGTRGSDLALYQANFIRDILKDEHGCHVELKIIKTSGDKIDNLSFDKMEGKGFFTKELEDALLQGEVDLAVHSLKDLMTTQPDGLMLGAVGYRADRREMLLVRKQSRVGEGLLPVKAGGVIGTSSARRKCQIAYHNPSLEIRDLRGNVPTRVNKLRDGQYDAIMIAAAGVTRLQLDLLDLDVILLEPDEFLPAPAQGILGIQIRRNDAKTQEIISRLNSEKESTEASLERGLLSRFDAGCSLPMGVFSSVLDGQLTLKAVLGVRKGDGWDGLKRVEVSGRDVSALVGEAYAGLTGKEAHCA
jgi:hydroxymethylbilane synthase